MTDLPSQIRRKALDLGFHRVGFAGPQKSQHAAYFQQWLDEGRHGEMEWLRDRAALRVDPAQYFPGCRGVICVALNYHVPLEPAPDDAPRARVARYALGADYHQAIKDRLYTLADWLRERVPGTQTRCGVDTVPVMERELAARAGIGWVGKNTCIINEQIGSWLLLGEVLTTLDLSPDQPAEDRCGTCSRCLDACPTQALSPYQIDASRCISYLNIERPGGIPPQFAQASGEWLFGCDICQDVCPWNRKAPGQTIPELIPRLPSATLDPRQILNWSQEDYYTALRGSALRRVKLPILKQNAAIVLKNLTPPT